MRHAKLRGRDDDRLRNVQVKEEYYYYKCNERTNVGQRCTCPNVRREKLDEAVFSAVEKRILGRGRLEELLKEVLELSDDKRQRME